MAEKCAVGFLHKNLGKPLIAFCKTFLGPPSVEKDTIVCWELKHLFLSFEFLDNKYRFSIIIKDYIKGDEKSAKEK